MEGTVPYVISETPWSLTDHGRKAEIKLKSCIYDLEAWSLLIREAQTTAPVRARVFYERLVTFFPTSGRYWRLYIEQEMRNKRYEQVEKLFQRSLMTVLNLDLWKCYISYVKDTKNGLQSFREKMRQTYEFALEHVGVDYHSTTIWLDYINFLKAETVQGVFAENQKIQNIRAAFHVAVVKPVNNVEHLWKEYNIFEAAVDKVNSRKFVESVSKHYMNAKRSSQELENISRGLIRGGTAIPLRGTPQEVQQLQAWKRVIAWEKSNPTRTEDQTVLVKRVLYAHEQCLLCFGHCADIWYESALYLQRASETGDLQCRAKWAEEASVMFERAVNGPLKSNILIHLAYADFEELHQKHDNTENIYNKLLEKKDVDPTLVYIQYMKYSQRVKGIKAARLIFKKAREDPRSKYHVFVSAANMEYLVNKDKTIALKIFELGMKKFGDEPGYIMTYLEHLAHLNEDNNTRVLFEKAVSSISVEKTKDIWEKFVQFESSVGDLSSLIKLEKRRAATIKGEDVRSKETVLLVDRYKFLDLLPCSDVELKVIGHPSVAHSTSTNGLPPRPDMTRLNRPMAAMGATAPVGRRGGGTIEQSSLIKPDMKQMVPFKPSASMGVGMNCIPGGTLPLPFAISTLLMLLPPPSSFHGPFVQVDEFIRLLVMDRAGPSVDGSEAGSVDEPGKGGVGVKRRREGKDVDGELVGNAPMNDIYRARQQKRVHIA